MAASNDAGRALAMTNAQRQAKHRAKRQRELEALRAVVPSSQNERDLAGQVQRLAMQLEKAHKDAAAQQARIDAMEAEQGGLQALRDAWHSLIPKLTPAAQHVVRSHVRASPAAKWLGSAIAAPTLPARAAQPERYDPPPIF